MKATLFMPDKKDPVAVLDEVQIIKMNDNHLKSPYRISYKSSQLNAGRVMLELYRDRKLMMKLEDNL